MLCGIFRMVMQRDFFVRTSRRFFHMQRYMPKLDAAGMCRSADVYKRQGVRSEYIVDISDIAIGHHIHTIMIGLSGFKSGDFVFINFASKLWFCRNQAGRAVQLPPRSPEYVVYIIGHITGEHGLVAVLEADGGAVDLHHINDFYGRHRNSLNSRDIQEISTQV